MPLFLGSLRNVFITAPQSLSFFQSCFQDSPDVSENTNKSVCGCCMQPRTKFLLVLSEIGVVSFTLIPKSRLYFDIFDCREFRMEIDLPPSGLAKLNSGEIVLLPPSSFSLAQGERDRAYLEKSWNFYLSKLAVRQIADRLMSCFYQHDETWWLSIPIERLIRIATEIQLQLTQWYSSYSFTVKNPPWSLICL
jgi:hypothetical protein